jgi:hypothetical protein
MRNEDDTRQLYRGFEGGAVYTAEKDGKFLVITDESSLADLLSEDDLKDMNLVNTVEFSSESERAEYLLHRYGPTEKGFASQGKSDAIRA